jgi:hypothetical protein
MELFFCLICQAGGEGRGAAASLELPVRLGHQPLLQSTIASCSPFLELLISLVRNLLLKIMSSKVSPRIQEVRDLVKQDPSKAAPSYQQILSEGPGSTEASSRDYEHALIGLGEAYRDAKKPQEIADLIKTSRDTFSSFAKAKTAKLGK